MELSSPKRFFPKTAASTAAVEHGRSIFNRSLCQTERLGEKSGECKTVFLRVCEGFLIVSLEFLKLFFHKFVFQHQGF